MEDYDKTESMERVETENSQHCGNEFTPPPKKHKNTDEVQGEFKQIKPPNLYGEVKPGHEDGTWLLAMKNYFHLYNYSINLKVNMAVII